jgi:energy-coupling factor transporter ATP-binding protein EcfA2
VVYVQLDLGNNRIVLISGKQGAGKSTLASRLVDLAPSAGYEPWHTKFAAPLYEMHDAILQVAKKYGIPAGPKEGDLLQYIGTEWGRGRKGPDVWVNALRAGLAFHLNVMKWQKPDSRVLVIVDDLRFENEFDAFTPGPGVTRVRLEAGREVRKARCSYWREADAHPSEVGLDAYADAGRFDLYLGDPKRSPKGLDSDDWTIEMGARTLLNLVGGADSLAPRQSEHTPKGGV